MGIPAMVSIVINHECFLALKIVGRSRMPTRAAAIMNPSVAAIWFCQP